MEVGDKGIKQEEDKIPTWWWLKAGSPFYFNRWVLLVVAIVYLVLSIWFSFKFDLPTLVSSSGAVIGLMGFLLTIKHSQLFHRKDLSLKDKYDAANGAMSFGSTAFPVSHQVWIKNIMLDEKLSVLLMIAGTLIWAYA
ncbi:hypothetical protein [Pseudoalteromonas sp. BDTF-M6]|uniref:hypothetical protein n=1 Tax=Pseudoalteromonas sp. BDTF-M6 TaxID=2796132 RepID=UPI001BAF0C59|nr:hypothetical protein [Pseudoalteromonas sp. BDTF-M6]MBS3796664.1 hypothetical protein [Pseudoalteromonas sp. BDTF-M6]